MATTTASLTISSGDLVSDVLNISVSETLYGTAGTTGPTLTSGLLRTKPGTSIAVLHTATSYANPAYVFIKNTDTTYTNSVLLTVAGESVGYLYGGQFTFIPWDTTSDLKTTLVSADTVVETIVIYTS